MQLTEKLLLPPMDSDAERQAVLEKWVRQRGRGATGYLLTINPGEEGWVFQRGNGRRRQVHYAVIERNGQPAKPRPIHRRATW